MGQKIQLDQIVIDTPKRDLETVTRQGFNATIDIIDNLAKFPGKVSFENVSGVDTVLRITENPLQRLQGQAGDTTVGAEYAALSSVGGQFYMYPISHLDLTTGSVSGSIDVGTPPTTTTGYWRWLLITARQDQGEWQLNWGDQVSSTPAYGSSMPVMPSGQLEVASIRLHNSGGSTWNFLRPAISDIYNHIKGGGGSSSGSGSGINYIANSTLDTGVTDYNTYADAAGTSPVDGTGGSPSITFTPNTTTPLRGTGDGKISKPASDCQGQGVSTDITIALADATQPAKVSFSYRTTTPSNFSFANEDLRIWMYDKDASELIPVTPYQMDGSGKFVGEFQFNSNTSSNYRLIFHIATTNANAWDFYIDDVKVGPSSEQSFVSLQDKQYTNNIASSTGFTTTRCVTIPYKTRDGAWRLKFNVHGARTTGSYGSSFTVNLSGVTFKNISNFRQAVSVGATNMSSDANIGWGFASEGTGNLYILMSSNDPSALIISGDVELDSMPTWAVDFYPVQLSDGADTRVVSVNYRGTVTGTIDSSYNFNPMTFTTKVKDSHNFYSGGVFAPLIAGDYDVSAFTQINGSLTVSTSKVAISIFINGVEKYTKYGVAIATNSITIDIKQGSIPLVYGDLVTIQATGNQAGLTYEADASRHGLSITRSPGPATITKAQAVNFKYSGNAGQSLSATPIIVVNTTRSYATHDMYNSGVITLPRAGKFLLTCCYWVQTTATSSGESFSVQINTGSVANAGTVIADARELTVASGFYPSYRPTSFPINGNAKDTFSVQMWSDLGASRSIYTGALDCWVELHNVD